MARTDAGLETTGKVDVTWQDFGVEPPNMGFGSVADTGSIEFFRKFTKSQPRTYDFPSSIIRNREGERFRERVDTGGSRRKAQATL